MAKSRKIDFCYHRKTNDYPVLTLKIYTISKALNVQLKLKDY